MDQLREVMLDIVERNRPMTVRQVFYALTVTNLIHKTEAEYNSVVVRLLTQMRRDGSLPYEWIADNTRWVRRPRTYRGIGDALERTAQLYRRSLWAEAPVDVEIWCEKDALAGVLMEETHVYDVRLMVSRGFSSDTYLQSAATEIKATGKPTYIYQFGDHDPSGVWIARKIEEGLRRHAPEAEIHFERVAVRMEQIAAWNLPSRPTKQTDSRAKSFVGDSVELDAIPPLKLRELVRSCIERHVDQRAIEVLQIAEESERAFLLSLAAQAPRYAAS
jgi:hypothetical protein